VSDKERKVELDTRFRDVASVLSEKCVNPESNRPYTVSMVERALKDAHFSVDPHRPAKAQALEVGALAEGCWFELLNRLEHPQHLLQVPSCGVTRRAAACRPRAAFQARPWVD
jgi:hypothetical protein